MQKAGEALGRGAPGAAAHGRAARESLKRARQALKREGRVSKPRPGNEGDGDGPAGQDKIDIPPAGGSLPRALRQRILEGGRMAWPERFRESLKRYYEGLLR